MPILYIDIVRRYSCSVCSAAISIWVLMTSPLKSLWGWNPAHCSGDNPELQLTLSDTDPQDMVAKKRGSADPSFTEDDFVLFLEKCVHTGIFELAAKRFRLGRKSRNSLQAPRTIDDIVFEQKQRDFSVNSLSKNDWKRCKHCLKLHLLTQRFHYASRPRILSRISANYVLRKEAPNKHY